MDFREQRSAEFKKQMATLRSLYGSIGLLIAAGIMLAFALGVLVGRTMR
jgi:hypothetical protein